MGTKTPGSPPTRLLVLLAANEWGKAPWEITGEPDDNATRVKWFVTWRQAFRLGAIGWGNKVRGLSLG